MAIATIPYSPNTRTNRNARRSTGSGSLARQGLTQPRSYSQAAGTPQTAQATTPPPTPGFFGGLNLGPPQNVDTGTSRPRMRYGRIFGDDGNLDMQQLFRYYNQVQDQAFAANEGRYSQGLSTLQQSLDAALAAIEGQGETGRQDILERERDASGGISQSMIDRGLYNTTSLDNLQSENRYYADRSIGALNEGLAAQRSGLYTQGAGMLSDFIASRQDPYPDMSQIMPMIMQYMQSRAETETLEEDPNTNPNPWGGDPNAPFNVRRRTGNRSFAGRGI